MVHPIPVIAGEYLTLDQVLLADTMYSNSLGLCVFAAAICLLRPLSFSTSVASLKTTLVRLAGSTLDFVLIYVLLLMAFGHTMVISFGHQVEYMRSLGYALYTEAGLSMLGLSRSVSGNLVDTMSRGFLVLTFSIITQIIIMNLFISIIVITVNEVKEDLGTQARERELSEHLWRKIRKWFGLNPDTPSQNTEKDSVKGKEKGKRKAKH